MGWDRVRDARRRLSREQGTVIKDWGGRIPFALIYPNSYYIGMSNLGLHAIYRLLNGYSNIVAERAFWERENRESRLAALALVLFPVSFRNAFSISPCTVGALACHWEP